MEHQDVSAYQDWKIGIVGTGVIGASWAAYFLSHGFSVAATDPAVGAEMRLRDFVDEFWPTLERIGLAPGANRERLSFDANLERALAGSHFVQENGPERLDVKRNLLAEISSVVSKNTIIASSSSSFKISDIQDAATHPDRIVLGHPYNPPHVIPLVEVVGGHLTSESTIDATIDFYRAIGKKPIHIKREVIGHLANRLQAALWREAFHLVQAGVADIADVDTAMAYGPGLRWALLGPFLNLHLAGGAGGIGHTFDHLGPPLEACWRDLGDFGMFTAEFREQAVGGVAAALTGKDLSSLMRERDDVLVSLLKMKAGAENLP